MKYQIIAIIVLSLSIISVTDSFAASITIDTNKDSFSIGDTVQINGNVEQGNPGDLVAIEVKNNAGDTILVRTVELESGGSFSLSFRVSESQSTGSYEIIANAQVNGDTISESKDISLTQKQVTTNGSDQQVPSSESDQGGGCLIATATYGSELAPEVQMLRELRDNTILGTTSGTAFMTGFNQFYYSFSPTISDWERENSMFQDVVRVSIVPLLTSLSILNHVDIDSEEEMLGYGIGIILLNVGMYFCAPAILVLKVKSKIKTGMKSYD